MAAALKQNMTVDEFLVWSTTQPGRFELFCGAVYAMSPERAGHATVKYAVQTELARAIKEAGLPCFMLPDGMTVRISEDTAHEPDALVYCGPRVPRDTVEIKNPMIVVEVLSPSTRHIDASAKLVSYFLVPSIQHYLIVDPEPERRPSILHSRQSDGSFLTTIIRSGTVRLDPPGLQLNIQSFFD